MLLLAALLSIAGTACVRGSEALNPPRPLRGDCEVTFAFGHRAPSGKYAIRSETVCIKRAGHGLEIPSNIDLYVADQPTNLGKLRYCKGPAEAPSEPDLEDKAVERCLWNGTFRDKYPLTFEIKVHSPRTGRIADHVQLVHVFRNGSLVYRWVPSEDGGQAIVIEGKQLEGTGVPHLADFDLRVYPADVDVDAALRERLPEARTDVIGARFEAATNAVVTTALPRSNERTRCFLAQVDVLRARLAELARRPAPPALVPSTTTCPEADGLVTGLPDLTAAYEDLQKKGRAELAEATTKLKKDAEVALRRAGIDLTGAADPIRKALEAELKALAVKLIPALAGDARAEIEARIAAVEAEIRALDTVVRETLAAIDEGNRILAAMDADLRDLAAYDAEDVAKLHAAVVQSAVDQGDFFEPYGTNPPLTGKERALQMRYADAIQVYFLAPWNGVPFRVTSELESEPSPAYAIPIVDLFGIRMQFDRSRFAEVRFATLGSMVFLDKDVSGEETFRWAAVTSLGIGTFRLGLALVPDADDALSGFSRHVRFVVGADLYKLITGRTLDVSTVTE